MFFHGLAKTLASVECLSRVKKVYDEMTKKASDREKWERTVNKVLLWEKKVGQKRLDI